MKLLKKLAVVAFCCVIIMPLLTFNFTDEAISEIDNRELTKNPFTLKEGDFTNNVDNYISDRIGFRNEMILGYTLLNDKLFGEMIHPIYTYGKHKCVFGEGITTDVRYNEYHEVFVDVVKQIQDFCEERGIPFLFVFNPAKPAIMEEYISEGINYNREWVSELFHALDEKEVNYLDNTQVLKNEKELGVNVFNFKYDANHWNDYGAFYGTNAMLAKMKEQIPEVHVNTLEDVSFSEKNEKTLLVSKFPINELVPVATVHSNVEDISEKYVEEIKLHESYRNFGYYVNAERIKENAPRALVFQGSYMNGYGEKYLQNAFGEYIHVHDYQNVLNFDYYYNIFKPDCVIFEVAEYTLYDGYFDFEKMKNMKLQNTFQTALKNVKSVENNKLNNITVNRGNTLTDIKWDNPQELEQAWLFLGSNEFDMKKTETGYEVTVLTEDYDAYEREISIMGLSGDIMHKCVE